MADHPGSPPKQQQEAPGHTGEMMPKPDHGETQLSLENIEDNSAEEWDVTFRADIYSMFYLCRAAVAHLKPGSAIINTSSIDAISPSPHARVRDDKGRHCELYV